MATLYSNIASLITCSDEGLGALGEIRNASLVVENGRIVWLGEQHDSPACDEMVDCELGTVIPGFVDSHAHLVFAGDRAAEFEARMNGDAYAAGGIRITVNATRQSSIDDLTRNMKSLVDEMHAAGITTFESKSGYGLSLETERLSLEVAGQFTDEVTNLAAHVVPPEFKDNFDGYLAEVIAPSLSRDLHRWVDVFCDRGAFTIEQTRQIFTAALAQGCELRLHAQQLEHSNSIQLVEEFDIASVDHCTHMSDHDLELMASTSTVATLLPGAEFSTRAQYPDARRFDSAGVPLAIATDCNPGSSFTTSMAFCLAVAVRDMHFTPEQALLAATRGGAQALRRTDVGHLTVGGRANFVRLSSPSYLHMMYRPGVPLVSETVIDGHTIYRRNNVA